MNSGLQTSNTVAKASVAIALTSMQKCYEIQNIWFSSSYSTMLRTGSVITRTDYSLSVTLCLKDLQWNVLNINVISDSHRPLPIVQSSNTDIISTAVIIISSFLIYSALCECSISFQHPLPQWLSTVSRLFDCHMVPSF